MSADAVLQLLILISEAVVVCGLLLSFFSLREQFGYAPLYVTLGGFQHFQTLMATTLYIELYPGIVVSPGSAVLFTATLFAVLLVYIRDDAAQTRSLIVGVVAANLTISIIIGMASLHMNSDLLVETEYAHEHLLHWNMRAFVIGTATLILDVVLIIVLYEFFFRVFPRLLFARILAAMLIVTMVDTTLFVTATFYGSENLPRMIVAGLIGKSAIAVVYSILLTVYLLWSTRTFNAGSNTEQSHTRDIFHILTYKQRFELLEEEFKRDGMTGLFTRRFFDENLLRELSRAKRLSHSLNLVLFDIDNFKIINDTYGHQLGDEIIKALADSMQSAFRAADIPCRYGGEEFAVIMPDSTVEAATLATERLQSEFKSVCASRELIGADITTFTAGIASYPKDGDTAKALVVRADQRMYKGKESGRNRVMYDTVIMKALSIDKGDRSD